MHRALKEMKAIEAEAAERSAGGPDPGPALGSFSPAARPGPCRLADALAGPRRSDSGPRRGRASSR